jgi:hypothetical protein
MTSRFTRAVYGATPSKPRKLALTLLFMRTITERLIFREAATAELGIFNGACDIAICVNEVNCSGDADGSAFWVYESLDRIYWLAFRHGYGLIEIVAKRLRT